MSLRFFINKRFGLNNILLISYGFYVCVIYHFIISVPPPVQDKRNGLCTPSVVLSIRSGDIKKQLDDSYYSPCCNNIDQLFNLITMQELVDS